MVKRKRTTQQNNQDERNEDGPTRSSEVPLREDVKATDNLNFGSGLSSVEGRARSATTRSRSQQAPTEELKAAAVALRSSARLPCTKRLRKESASSTSKNNTQPKNSPQAAVKIKKNANGKKVVRTRRSWELWSVEDKNAFFEALCEYGKDFENIQLYIAQKSKKKGLPPNMIKNKDQVRFFYYRTWHKIAKFLDVGEDIKKPTLELYGLVNYAELRKKKGGCGLLNVKNQQKLNELVTKGETTFKYKGKKLKVRTPVCRALKKLNNIEDTKEPEIPRLPKEIEVEFRPKTNGAWMRVQNMAQNPRIKTKIGLHKRLSTLLAYLEKRWKPYRLRQKEKILETMPELASTSLPVEKMPSIRVFLLKDVTLCMLSVTSIDTACSEDVCLDNYIKGLAMSEQLKESAKDAGKPKKPVRTRILPLNAMQNKIVSQSTEENSAESNTDTKKLDKKQGDQEESESRVKNELEETGGEKEDNCPSTDPEIEAERSLNLLKNMIQSITPDAGEIKPNEADPLKNVEQDEPCSISNALEKTSENTCPAALDLFLANQSENKNLTFGQFLSLTESEDNKEIESVNDTEKKLDTEDDNKRAEDQAKINKKKEELMNKIRKGWTREECRTLTIGELYLMLNHPEKIVLEYDFEVLGDPQVKVMADSELEAVRIPKNLRVHHLPEILNNLVAVASHYFTDFKAKPTPVSPTTRLQSKSTAAPTQSKGAGSNRANARNPGGNKMTNNAKANKCAPTEVGGSVERPPELVIPPVTTATPTINKIAVSDSVNVDKQHQFAMPVRTAPRQYKISTSNPRNDSVMQQLDKLVDMQRRNNRSRNRRSLVVPRPLLPSTADNSGMTVVHLLPSSGSLSPLTVTNVGGVKKIILPKQQTVLPKSAIGLTPVQILNPIAPTPRGLMFPAASLAPSRVVVGTNATPTVISNTSLHAVVTTVPSVITPSTLAVSNSVDDIAISGNTLLSLQTTLAGTPNSKISVNPLSLNVITNDGQVQQRIGNLRITAGSDNSPPQISIPEAPSDTSSLQIPSQSSSQNTSFAPNICSLLDLSEGLNQIPHPVSDHLLDFNSNSSISGNFGLSTKSSSSNTHLSPLIKQARTSDNDPLVSNRVQPTPPLSPNGSRFKINSPGPETNWLNGESSDFSLSSLLNTLESPVKNIQCVPSDGSTLDAMSRLGPDVDNNLQCLINESSVDYVAKFADLAAQIASTATENKCT